MTRSPDGGAPPPSTEPRATGPPDRIDRAPSPLAVLRRNRDLRFIWFSQIASETGDWLTRVAVTSYVANKTEQPALIVAGVQALMIVPFFFVSPLAGVVADRFPRRTIILVVDTLAAFVVLLYLWVFRMEPGPAAWAALSVIIFTHLGLAAFFEAARTSLVAAVARPEELAPANALTQVTWSICLALGSALSGVLLYFTSRDVAVAVDSFSFLLGVLFISFVKGGRAAAVKVAGESGGFLEGLRYLRQHPTSGAMLLPKLALGFVGMNDLTFALLGPRVHGVPSEDVLALYFLAIGIGTFLGPPIGLTLTRGNPRAMRYGIAVAFICESAIFSGTLFVNSLYWAVAFAGLATAGGSVIWTFSSSLLQRATPDRVTGRAVATDLGLFTMTIAVSLLLGGVLVDFVGLTAQHLLTITTLVYLTGGIAWYCVLRWVGSRPWEGDLGRPT